jgi:hypothetical protein
MYSIPCFAHLAAKTVDEWAEDNIILRDSGRLRYAETPWMREPTRAAGEVYTTCRVVISTPAQSAKTTAIIAVLCHQAVAKVANCYSEQSVALRYANLYEEVIGEK